MSTDKEYMIDDLYNASDDKLATIIRASIDQYRLALQSGHRGADTDFDNISNAHINITIVEK